MNRFGNIGFIMAALCIIGTSLFAGNTFSSGCKLVGLPSDIFMQKAKDGVGFFYLSGVNSHTTSGTYRILMKYVDAFEKNKTDGESIFAFIKRVGTSEEKAAIDSMLSSCFSPESNINSCKRKFAMGELSISFPGQVQAVSFVNKNGTDTVQGYCGIDADGEVWTYLPITWNKSITNDDMENICAQYGMHLFVPRTRAHLEQAKSFGTQYLKLVGIYPVSNGATCSHIPMDSDHCHNWKPKDGGRFFVYDGTNIGEPNGDNTVHTALFLSFNSNKEITYYNDVVNMSVYATQYFMCSSPDDM